MKQIIQLTAALPTLSTPLHTAIVDIILTDCPLQDIGTTHLLRLKEELKKAHYHPLDIKQAMQYAKQIKCFATDLLSWIRIAQNVWWDRSGKELCADDLVPLTIAAIPTTLTTKEHDYLLKKLEQAISVISGAQQYYATNLGAAIFQIKKEEELGRLEQEEEQRRYQQIAAAVEKERAQEQYVMPTEEENKEVIAYLRKRCHAYLKTIDRPSFKPSNEIPMQEKPHQMTVLDQKKQFITQLTDLLDDDKISHNDRLVKFKLHFEAEENQTLLTTKSSKRSLRILRTILSFLTFGYVERDPDQAFVKKSRRLLNQHTHRLFTSYTNKHLVSSKESDIELKPTFYSSPFKNALFQRGTAVSAGTFCVKLADVGNSLKNGASLCANALLPVVPIGPLSLHLGQSTRVGQRN